MANLAMRAQNMALINDLDSEGGCKEAANRITDFTRLKLREDGILRTVLPSVGIGPENIDRAVETDLPQVITDMEPNAPAAVSVAFGTFGAEWQLLGRRYRTLFDRIFSQAFWKDVAELYTYEMDLRQVMSDNSLNEVLAEEDSKLIQVCDLILMDPDQPNPVLGDVPMWKDFSDGNAAGNPVYKVDRDGMAALTEIMPSSNCYLETEMFLMNHITVKRFLRLRRNDAGGDLSQELMQRGLSVLVGASGIFDKPVVVTIKRHLVKNGEVYMFSAQKFMGKHFSIEDTTMAIKREQFLLSFFAFQLTGFTVANPASIAKGTLDM